MAKKLHATSLQLPGKSWLYRATLLLMVAFGLTLLIMSKTGNPAVSRLRTAITDIAAPVLSVAASPLDAVYNIGAWVTEMARLREENLLLKSQNAQLIQWQAAAKAMATENESLRELLHVVPSPSYTYVTAKVISDLGGPYVHSTLINGGSTHGIRKDQAVLSDNGLMGRVVEAGMNSARVLLLNDINSRVPVMGEHSQEKSILIGNNTGLPTLSYLSVDSRVAVGERIVTSGDGGIFPPGIPVGIVTHIEQGSVKVQPFVDALRVQYVSVVDYAL